MGHGEEDVHTAQRQQDVQPKRARVERNLRQELQQPSPRRSRSDGQYAQPLQHLSDDAANVTRTSTTISAPLTIGWTICSAASTSKRRCCECDPFFAAAAVFADVRCGKRHLCCAVSCTA